MCGIMGCSRLTDVTRRMMPLLAWTIEERGKDSWGATNGVDVIKHLGPITKSWDPEIPTWMGWDRAIFHARAASVGAVSITNQHPFHVQKDGVEMLGIHNGCISNHEALNTKYADRKFECDSPHVFMAIAGFSPTTEVTGWGNLAWYVRSPENPIPSLHFAKFNADNLFVASLESGEVVFCSLKDPIERAAYMAGSKVKIFYNIESDHHYRTGPNPDNPDHDAMFKIGDMKFGNRAYTVTSQQEFTSYFSGRQRGMASTYPGLSERAQRYTASVSPTIDQLGAKDRDANICLSSNCLEKVETTRRKSLLCVRCLARVQTQMSRLRIERELQEQVIGPRV